MQTAWKQNIKHLITYGIIEENNPSKRSQNIEKLFEMIDDQIVKGKKELIRNIKQLA